MSDPVKTEDRTSPESVQCPACNGDKTMTAVFVKYAPGYSGPPIREFDCYLCNGKGEVPKDQIERTDRGNAFRRFRVSELGLGLREAADKWGMKASELSLIEQGMTETDWKPPGFPG